MVTRGRSLKIVQNYAEIAENCCIIDNKKVDVLNPFLWKVFFQHPLFGDLLAFKQHFLCMTYMKNKMISKYHGSKVIEI